MLCPGQCPNISTVAMTLPGCLVAALFFSPYRSPLLPQKGQGDKENCQRTNILWPKKYEKFELDYSAVRLGLALWKAECAP